MRRWLWVLAWAVGGAAALRVHSIVEQGGVGEAVRTLGAKVVWHFDQATDSWQELETSKLTALLAGSANLERAQHLAGLMRGVDTIPLDLYKRFEPAKLRHLPKTQTLPDGPIGRATERDDEDRVHRAKLGPDAPERNAGWLQEFGSISKASASALAEIKYELAAVDETSVFYLLPLDARSTVVERFYNGARWVYVRHYTSPTTSVKSIFIHQRRVFAFTTNGYLAERRRNTMDRLEWAVVLTSKEALMGVSSTRHKSGSLFVLSNFDQIVERRGTQQATVESGEFEPGVSNVEHMAMFSQMNMMRERPVALLDVESLEPSLLFLAGANGGLLEALLNARQQYVSLRNLGHPPRMPLAPFRGASLRKAKSTLARSLFLVALTGELIELVLRLDENLYEWVVHGMPGQALRTAPGPSLHERSVFVVTVSGTVAERFQRGAEWIWLDHGCPVDEAGTVLPVAQTPGVVLNDITVFFKLENGLLAARSWEGKHWTWTVVDVPEVGSAEYCEGDKSSLNSCMAISA